MSQPSLLLLAFLGGVLTILSPCILPVVPLAFPRAARSFARETLPMLVGLAIAFTLSASIATATARWLLVASEAGRAVALVLLALAGLALVSGTVAARLARPFTRAGARLLPPPATTRVPSPARQIVIGLAIGLLWAPCAGPILGLLIAVAATAMGTAPVLLFLTFALGAVVSLAIVLSLGARFLARLRAAGVAETAVRRALGVATLLTVIALAGGWDRLLFARGGFVQTASAEESLVRRFAPAARPAATAGVSLEDFAAGARSPSPDRPHSERPLLTPVDGALPSLDGGTEWLNGPPLSPSALRGKVVLVDFWTFACYNCLNALPHVKALYAKYRDRGFVVVGVHTPELPHERVVENVRREVRTLGIPYPVVIDNDWRIWRAFHNQYWPAAYFADATGQLRFYHFGEGRYDEMDQVVARLLDERDARTGGAMGGRGR